MLFSTILCLSAAAAGVFAAPLEARQQNNLPKCNKKTGLTFNLKVHSLENATSNYILSAVNGFFIVDSQGAAGFDPNALTEYYVNKTSKFLFENDGSKIATVKTSDDGSPHKGDIVFLTENDSIDKQYSPLRCQGLDSNPPVLNCTANFESRSYAQICGKFINMGAGREKNCQDHIQFDVIPTCRKQNN
ncbi:hypothetical protein H2200_010212 [Cladophialophora chaetospira]|uniref:Uncharacterized protein n=1 Tax=Cladophialophora chaetospira TaxID=386627 RepID=A0AA39CEJ3_9EURO|nr:hypothetical protein H2200_010212 [Cladophialophora chaetospira]